ncbi:MAG: hypothetical protein JWR44_3611 [Hymenobacter sp.]|jgi:hypothetical protein|nr:hypothetical protein [Hymenobacter sp.]
MLLAGLLGLAPAAFAQSGLPAPTVYPSGGTQCLGLAVGDVNGDGRADIVVANQTGNNVGVLLNQPGLVGSFAPVVTYATNGNQPSGVALGDVNGDGRTDIVVANQGSYTMGVLLGSATAPGTFGSALTYPSGGNTPNIVALADVNGDNRPDIVVTNRDSGSAGVLLGSSTVPGTFALAVAYAVGSTPIGLAVGDVNNDGRPDIVTGNRNINGSVSVLLGSAAAPGTFSPVVSYPSGSANTQGVALGDVNGDGRTDIVAIHPNGIASVGVLLGTPSAFAPAVTYPTGGSTPNFVALGDVNGDGRLDAVVPNHGSGAVGVLMGQATPRGSFAPAATYANAGNNPFNIALGDVDGDGRPDVVTANYSNGTVSVFANNYTPLATASAWAAAAINPYPNPARDAFSVDVPDVTGAAAVQAVLLNALGQVARRQQAVLPAGGTRLNVKTAGLAPGMYTLRVQAGRLATARRVVLH